MDNHQASMQEEDLQESTSRLLALTPRADAGDDQALLELRALLSEVPSLAEYVGSMRYQAERSLLQLALRGNAGGTEGSIEILHKQQSRMRGKLKADGDGSLLDEMLCEQIVIDSLAVQVATMEVQRGGTVQQFEYRSRQLDRAHRRYLRSIRLLATTRRQLAGDSSNSKTG